MTSAQPRPPLTVLTVRDTRDFVEDGDRFVAVPGSGDQRECDRCSRLHEIHADVRDADGRAWTVGVGCATSTAEARKLSAQATRRAKDAARRAATEERASRYAQAVREVEALSPPEVVRGSDNERSSGKVWWTMGDARVGVFPGSDEDERLACLLNSWRARRIAERLDDRVGRYEAAFRQVDRGQPPEVGI